MKGPGSHFVPDSPAQTGN